MYTTEQHLGASKLCWGISLVGFAVYHAWHECQQLRSAVRQGRRLADAKERFRKKNARDQEILQDDQEISQGTMSSLTPDNSAQSDGGDKRQSWWYFPGAWDDYFCDPWNWVQWMGFLGSIVSVSMVS